MVKKLAVTECKVIFFLGLFIGKLQLSGSICPDKTGWEEKGDNCMKKHEDRVEWTKAKDICSKKSGKLVSILSAVEQESLENLTKDGNYWIGAHIPALVFESYFNRCLDGHGFRNSSCFQILPEPLSWSDAQKSCKDHGGRLAVIRDEETNIFIGKAMTDMVLKRNLTSDRKNGAVRSYWIDGQCKDGTLDFYDTEGNLLSYTNFISPKVQQGLSCLEVFPVTLTRQGPEEPDLDKMMKDANDEAMEEAMKALPTGLPPGILPPASTGPEDSPTSPNEPNSTVPRYSILRCNERRVAVCEFSLKVIEKRSNESSSGEDREKVENTTSSMSPSRVQSCKTLAMLSKYSDKTSDLRGNRNDRANSGKNRGSVMSQYRNLKGGYYIFEKPDSSNEENDGKETNSTVVKYYDLKFCDMESLKKRLSDDLSYSIQHFQWIRSDSKSDSSISSLGLLRDEDVFNGPCMITSKTRGNWNTSHCSEKFKFVCEFSTRAVKEHFCQDAEDEPWCQEEDSLEQLNEDSRKLLRDLNDQSQQYMVEGSSVGLDLHALAERAKNLLSSRTSIEATKEEVENFTSNILSSASIVLNQELTYFRDDQVSVKTTVDAINILSEYAADVLQMIAKQDIGRTDVTTLSVNSSGIALQIRAVDAEFRNNTFDSYSNFKSENGETMEIYMSNEQKNLSETFGVTFINVQYSTLGKESHIPRSLDTISGYGYSPKNDSDQTPTVMRIYNNFYNPVARGKTYSMLASGMQTATTRIKGKNYPTTVQFTMHKKNTTTNLERIHGTEMCAFLDQSKNAGDRSIKWSTEGCHLVYVESDKYRCECSHTTDFAVLLLVFQPLEDLLVGHRRVLAFLTVTGHVLSILCLLASIVLFLTLKRELKSDRRMIHVNLFVALLLANITMLLTQLTNQYGVLSALDDYESDSDTPSCIALTFFNHLLLLSSLFWMLIEGIVIYRKIVVVLSRQRKVFNNAFYVIGWGLPLMISLISVIVGKCTNVVYHTEGCWLSVQGGMIWAFAGPVICIVLVNSIILFMVLRVAMRTQKRKVARRADATDSDKSKMTRMVYLKTVARGLIVLTPLLGLTWMVGLVMVHVSMAYIFVLLNASQGISLFICYCVCNPEIRAALDMKWKHYKARHFTAMHEEKPLATVDGGVPKTSTWLKTKLLMRLSFSTTSSRTQDKFHNSLQKTSEGIEEREEEEQKFERQRASTPIPSNFSSPRSDRSMVNKRQSSASTHATHMSSDSSTSSASVTGTVSSFSKHLLPKKTRAKIAPVGLERSRHIQSNRRPSTADGTLIRKHLQTVVLDREMQRNKYFSSLRQTSPGSVSPFRRKLTRQLAYGGSEVTIQRHDNFGETSLKGAEVGKQRKFEEESSDKEETISNITFDSVNHALDLDDDNQDGCGYPAHHDSVDKRGPNIIAKELSSKESDQPECDLCCREYYNVFNSEGPVTIYSNSYSRRMKSKKQNRADDSTGHRESRADTPREDLCISRCCPRCHPAGQKRGPVMHTIPGKHETHCKNSSPLEPMDSRSKGIYLEDATYRPNSRVSRDSGILPDDIEEFDITNPL